MAIKFKITKSAFEKLSDDLKEAYKPEGDGYIADVTGAPEPEGAPELKRALERVRADNDDLKEDLKTVTAERDEIKRTMGDSDRDVQKLTQRHDKKVASLTEDYEAKLAAKDKIIIDGEIGRAADALANKISTSPGVIRPHILSRLTAEFDNDGKPVVKVMKDGKVSDLTLEKLGEEFVANRDFAAIIRASNASGGRATTALPGQQAVPDNKDAGKKPDLVSMTVEERVAHIKQVKQQSQNAA